jgi:hypothetical protein
MKKRMYSLLTLAFVGLACATSAATIKAADAPNDPYWSKYWHWYHQQYTPYYSQSYGVDYPDYGAPPDAYGPYPYSTAFGYPEYGNPDYVYYGYRAGNYPAQGWYNGPRAQRWNDADVHRDQYRDAHHGDSRFHYGWR